MAQTIKTGGALSGIGNARSPRSAEAPERSPVEADEPDPVRFDACSPARLRTSRIARAPSPDLFVERVFRAWCAEQPILQHERRDAPIVQPIGNLPSRSLHDKLRMAASRGDDHGGSRRLLFWRKKNVNRAVLRIDGRFRDFRRRDALRTRRAVRPKANLFAALDRGSRSQREKRSKQQYRLHQVSFSR